MLTSSVTVVRFGVIVATLLQLLVPLRGVWSWEAAGSDDRAMRRGTAHNHVPAGESKREY